MATNHYRGTGNMHLQRSQVRYGLQAGFLREYEYRGLSAFQAQTVANQWAALGAEYQLTNQLGIHTLIVSDPTATGGSGDEIVIDVWEIGVTQTTKKSVANPRNVANISAANITLIARAERDNSTLKEAAARLKEDTGTTYDATLTDAEAIRLWERIQKGQDSYWEDQYVVRHTTNVSNRYPYNIADTNKNCIYSPAQFYSEVQSVLLWLFPMPNAFVNVLTSNTPPATPSNYYWGYLKTGSPRITIANNRSQIITEYRQALWSTDEYSLIS